MVAAPVSAHSDRSAAVTEIDYGLRNRDTRTLVSENCLYEALCICLSHLTALVVDYSHCSSCSSANSLDLP
jgi:hypothetical protein